MLNRFVYKIELFLPLCPHAPSSASTSTGRDAAGHTVKHEKTGLSAPPSLTPGGPGSEAEESSPAAAANLGGRVSSKPSPQDDTVKRIDGYVTPGGPSAAASGSRASATSSERLKNPAEREALSRNLKAMEDIVISTLENIDSEIAAAEGSEEQPAAAIDYFRPDADEKNIALDDAMRNVGSRDRLVALKNYLLAYVVAKMFEGVDTDVFKPVEGQPLLPDAYRIRITNALDEYIERKARS